METLSSLSPSGDRHFVPCLVNPRLDGEFRAAGLWNDSGVYDWWSAAVAAVGDQGAVIDSRGVRLTYSRADTAAASLSAALRTRGVGRGDVVAVVLPAWSDFLIAMVACLKIGAIVCPILPQLGYRELSFECELSGARAVIVATEFRSTSHMTHIPRLLDDCRNLAVIVTVGRAAAPRKDVIAFDDAVAVTPLAESQCTPARGNDVCAILFTSGTESAPKGVLLTHNNVIASERSFADVLGFGQSDRMFMPAPLAHATGFLHGLIMPITRLGTVILLDRFEGRSALELINTEGATAMMGTTTIVSEIMDAADDSGGFPSSLRSICCGGAPIPSTLVERGIAMGLTLHSVYGSTESAPHTMTRSDDPIERVLNSDGRAVPGTVVRIVDPSTHVTLPPGSEGEEASRGPGVFVGYLGDPQATSSSLDCDGWYYSGDLAVMDEDGYVRITGRIKDTIIRGGENVSAAEVEEILLHHPAVKECSVVSMPNPRLGESACAFLVLYSGARPPSLADVRDLFARMEVAKFKTPERVEVIDTLPMSLTGKVRKKELRALIRRTIRREGTR